MTPFAGPNANVINFTNTDDQRTSFPIGQFGNPDVVANIYINTAAWQDPARVISHEIGHVIGLDDEYLIKITKDGKEQWVEPTPDNLLFWDRKSVKNKNDDYNGIMGDLSKNPNPNDTDRKKALDNYKKYKDAKQPKPVPSGGGRPSVTMGPIIDLGPINNLIPRWDGSDPGDSSVPPGYVQIGKAEPVE